MSEANTVKIREEKESCYLFDWVSFTSKIDSTETIMERIGLKASNKVTWESAKGAHGYKDRLSFGKISIHYNGREDMGIWVEMSGQGCRAFEEYSETTYKELFEWILDQSKKQVKITRLDVAFDDHAGLLDIDKIFEDTKNGHFVSRFYTHSYQGGTMGMSVDHGRKGSKTLIRIYDKAAERKLIDGSHWIRVELQFRDERAMQFVGEFIKAEDESKYIGTVFMSVLNNYLRYVVPEDNDVNRWRWEMTDYWSRLTECAESIQLFTNMKLEYNYIRLHGYIFNQAVNCINALIAIDGTDNVLTELGKYAWQLEKKSKYKNLINEVWAERRNQDGYKPMPQESWSDISMEEKIEKLDRDEWKSYLHENKDKWQEPKNVEPEGWRSYLQEHEQKWGELSFSDELTRKLELWNKFCDEKEQKRLDN